MNQRNTQEEKFRNITIRAQPVRQPSPDTVTTHTVRPTLSPTNHSAHRPMSVVFQQNLPAPQPLPHNVQISTSQIIHEPAFQQYPRNVVFTQSTVNHGHSHSTLITSEIRQNQHAMITRLQSEILEKQSIINELKDLVRLSNQNSMKSKKSMIFDRSQTNIQQEKELNDLRHNVKILTIQNNTLSDYIQRLKKNQISRGSQQLQTTKPHKQSKQDMRLHKEEVSRLNQIIVELQTNYDKKIDEFIESHKSLANQCKTLEHQREQLLRDNHNLCVQINQMEESLKKGHHQEEKLNKHASNEKYSIVKIKEQYAQSLKQFKETVAFETEHLFDQFRNRFEVMLNNVSILQEKISIIENFIRNRDLKVSRMTKKSQIYIQEGAQSSFSDSEKRKSRQASSGPKPFAISQVFEDPRQNDEEQLTKPLKEEISRLKEIVHQLENKIGSRVEHSLRQKQLQKSRARIAREEKQKLLIEEVDKLKKQISYLEREYETQRQKITIESLKKDKTISQLKSELNNFKINYQQMMEQTRRYAEESHIQEQIQLENQKLKEQLRLCIVKIEQYKKLCIVLKEQSEQNSVQMDIFHDLKNKIYHIQEKYHQDLIKLHQLQHQRHELLNVNKQMKNKLQEALRNYNSSSQLEQKIKESVYILEKDKETMQNKIDYMSQNIKNLEKQLGGRKQNEKKLIDEKKVLEKQIVGYLSLFHKISLEESRNNKSVHSQEENDLDEVLNKISRLEASFSEINSTRRQKREKIVRLLSESLSEIQEPI